MKRYIALSISIFLLIGITDVFAENGKIVGTVKAKRARFVANTVIYIEKTEGNFSAPAEPVVMNQVNLEFIPHVLPVIQGTTINFKNSDDVLHNVFTPDKCAEKFNLGTWPKGEMRSFAFKEIGCASVLLCNVHPEMEAYVLVMQNPYFAVTDKKGNFEINDVPAGTYKLKVWNEKYRASDKEVTVTDSEAAEVSFTLKR